MDAENLTQLPNQWTQSVIDALAVLWAKLASFIPNFIGMLLILLVGYLISRVLRSIVSTVLHRAGIDSATQRIGVTDTLKGVGVQIPISEVVGRLVFWLFMLTFLISAAETLGLENVSQTIDSFVTYLPNVIAAVLITIVGLMLAHFVQTLVRTTAEGVGIDYARPISRVAYSILLIVVATLAIDQLGIETTLINNVIQIVLIAIGAALALALGIGTRDVAGNVIAGVYVRDLYKPGTQLKVAGVEGQLVQVGTVSTALSADDGKTYDIPNSDVLKNVVRSE